MKVAATGSGGHERSCGGLLKADCPAACCSCVCNCLVCCAEVVEAGEYMHPCEGEMVCKLTNTMVRAALLLLPQQSGACCGVACTKRLHVVRHCCCCVRMLHACCGYAGSCDTALLPSRRTCRCARRFLDAASPRALLTFAVRRSPTSTRPSSWRTRRRSARWTRSWARSTAW